MICVLGPLTSSLLGESVSRLYLQISNDWFDENSDVFIAEMLLDGRLRPARINDVRAWLQLAKSNGNDEIQQYGNSLANSALVSNEPVTLPNGMYGAHSRVFLIRPGDAVPKGSRESHNTFLFLEDGTCLGSYPGCSHL